MPRGLEPLHGDDSVPDKYDFRMPVSESGYLTVSQYLRERYLTPDVDEATVQAIGDELQVVIESERDSIAIRLPIKADECPVYSDGKSRSLGRNGVYIASWEHLIPRVEDDAPARVVVHE